MIIRLENKLSQTKKNWFYVIAMVDFFKTHDFGQKLHIFSLFFFLDKMGLEEVFDDCPRLQILYFT